MKLLCLHGYGTSGDIFEKQLASITRALGDHHEYVYIDGEFPVTKSGMSILIKLFAGLTEHTTDLAEVFPGPYLAFFKWRSPEDLSEAHDLLEATISSEEVPFDGVVAFSQGASLVISYIIQQQIEKPDNPPPFRFGLFFSSFAVQSPDADYNYTEFTFMSKLDHADVVAIHGIPTGNGQPALVPENFTGFGNLIRREQELCSALVRHFQAVIEARNFFGIEERDSPPPKHTRYSESNEQSDVARHFLRLLHPVYTTQRVPFPTVHVFGSDDAPAPRRLGKIAQELCDPDKLFLVENKGGAHDIPQKKSNVDAVVRAVEKAYFLGQRLW